ncbi:MAG: hypothetical protein A2288_02980 [Candidatus Moranbacteria bacterium RIFOXYA12_FULL_44_15]|nr:MAG: hypothetical protein A2288_02980 [Candidatus Moranbacteria bacterium RIFOXYA12_FULL_44_15]OGI35416.1 MAG: hypothetical protein A2259_03065 [Candidatus Moranbacteria bacterium RIFOXYA2_FULL_43_15]
MLGGFTLIELLIVIAIIGILASIVLVSLNSARTKAKQSKALSSMQSIKSMADVCVTSGGTLTIPASNGTGGSAICSDGSGILPNISDTTFTYCGSGCGGWTSTAGTNYAFSAYTDSFGARKIVVCGSDINISGWYYSGSPFNFTGSSGCKTDGFYL